MEKSTLHLKYCFIVETSVFLDKNVEKIRFFQAKNTNFNTENEFSHGKEYFTSEIVFYSGNLSFPR